MRILIIIISFSIISISALCQNKKFDFEKSDNIIEDYIFYLKQNNAQNIIIIESAIGKSMEYSIIKNFIYTIDNKCYLSFFTTYKLKTNKTKFISKQDISLENIDSSTFIEKINKLKDIFFEENKKPYSKLWKKRKWRNMIIVENKSIIIQNRAYKNTEGKNHINLFKIKNNANYLINKTQKQVKQEIAIQIK